MAKDINGSGGEVSHCPNIFPSLSDLRSTQAVPFSIPSYSHEDITNVWASIHSKFPKTGYAVRVAVFNAGEGVFKKFLDVTPDDVQKSLQTSVAAAFSFARGAILAFKDNDIEQPNGKRGALIFTGATASLRGNVYTSSFAAGKFGLRALSQSLSKEFGQENIHVSHVSSFFFFFFRFAQDSQIDSCSPHRFIYRPLSMEVRPFSFMHLITRCLPSLAF